MADIRFSAEERTFRTKSKSGGAGGAGTVARTDAKMVRANSLKTSLKNNRLFMDSPDSKLDKSSIKSSLFSYLDSPEPKKKEEPKTAEPEKKPPLTTTKDDDKKSEQGSTSSSKESS